MVNIPNVNFYHERLVKFFRPDAFDEDNSRSTTVSCEMGTLLGGAFPKGLLQKYWALFGSQHEGD